MKLVTICSALATALILISSYCFALASTDESLTFQVVQAQLNLNSSNVESAKAVQQDDGRYSVDIKLNPTAANEFARITSDGLEKNMNAVFNKKIISVATIRSQMGSSFSMAGLLKEDAEKIVSSLMGMKSKK